MATPAKKATTKNAATKAAQQAPAPVVATTPSAAVLATNLPSNAACTATGATGKNSQKLAYASGTTLLKLNPAAAKTGTQQQYVQWLQAVIGSAKQVQAGQLQTQLKAQAQALGMAKPGSVYRRSIRAGILVAG